jgi:hypothetical protein
MENVMGAASMNEELHIRTVMALTRACIGRMSTDDLSILCWHCGVPSESLISMIDTETVRNQLGEDILYQLEGVAP